MRWSTMRRDFNCPFCGGALTFVQTIEGRRVAAHSWDDLTRWCGGGLGAWCTGCNRKIVDGGGNRIEPGELRKSQIRAVDASGRELHVHYGPTKGLKARLKAQRIRWPDGFRGDGVRLARVMRMSISDLAREFEMSPGEFGNTMFDIGDTFLDKA
ncbi:hypothetical protein [uncultured Microbacterium sp.]|uniref:hypothetical protein n=1 Tax=uncultured Microbacterium sp. TaxID=191216 RepID=UPI0025F71ADF|nr:hypothetical protein [uncultured Microbacterium sp.]